jgi:hypothetical protein
MTTETTNAEAISPTDNLAALIAKCGLAMTAQYVPTEFSAKKHFSKNSEDWQHIAWECTLTTPRGSLATTFKQGLGHLPDSIRPRDRITIAMEEAIQKTLKTGKVYGLGAIVSRGPLQPPTLVDVLGSLCSDSSAIDSTFEDWASDFGYDADSRKAYATWERCRDLGLRLRQILGADFDAVREACSEAGV